MGALIMMRTAGGRASLRRLLGPPWLVAAMVPVVIAASISYQAVLAVRLPIGGLPVSITDFAVVLCLLATLYLAPASRRRPISLVVPFAAVVVLGALVGVLRSNNEYYFLRDLRAGLYLIVGVYLAGVVGGSREDLKCALRWIVLGVVVACAFQWVHFVSGFAYGPAALLAGSGVLRDTTIFQYSYAFGYGVLAATIGTRDRLFRDRYGIALACVFAATVLISLTRSAWASFALVAILALGLRRTRLVLLVVALSLLAALLPWLVLGLAGSPIAAAPLHRAAIINDPLSEADTVSARIAIAAEAFNNPPVPTPEASNSVASTLDSLSLRVFGFGYGHVISSFTFAFGQTVKGVTDLDSAPLTYLWKTGLAGLVLIGAGVLRALAAAFPLRRQDPLVAGWFIAILAVLCVGSFGGLTGAPYTMAVGGWLGLMYNGSRQADTPGVKSCRQHRNGERRRANDGTQPHSVEAPATSFMVLWRLLMPVRWLAAVWPFPRGRGRLAQLLLRPVLLLANESEEFSWPTKSGDVMRLRYRDQIGSHVAMFGGFEEAEVAALTSRVRVGGIAVDAGAHVGMMTVPLARRVGDRGQVLAFEPFPPTAERLKQNLAANRLDHVVIYQSALGSVDGDVMLELSPDAACCSIAGVPHGDKSGTKVVVACNRLDSIWERLGRPRIDALKIDVEGAELDVLGGATQLIASHLPVILVETTTNLGALRELLVPLGYRYLQPKGFYWWNHLFVTDG